MNLLIFPQGKSISFSADALYIFLSTSNLSGNYHFLYISERTSKLFDQFFNNRSYRPYLNRIR